MQTLLRAPILFSTALALLVVSWAMTNPPGAVPDEQAHFVKGLAAAQGQLAGSAPDGPVASGASADTGARGRAWQARTTRVFDLRDGRGSTGFGCNSRKPTQSAVCVDAGRQFPLAPVAIHIGTYQPFLYLPAGVAARAGNDAASGLRLARLTTAALAIALLTAATFALWSPAGGALSLIGLMVAVTPMAVFLAASLNPSGIEVAAAVCFVASLIRLTRPEAQPKWVWGSLAAGGVVLGLGRSLGPLFVLALTLAVIVVQGRPAVARLVNGRLAHAAWGAIAVGVGVCVVWEALFQPHPAIQITELIQSVGPAVENLRTIARQQVGVFGVLDSPLPGPAYLAWIMVLVLLIGAAFVLGTRRQWLSLAAVVATAPVLVVLISVIHRQTGFELQGRYVLPLLVAVPLLAGEVMLRNRDRVGLVWQRRLVLGIAAVTAGGQLIGWYANGRRHATGVDGTWLFPAEAEWQPLLSWWPWLAVCALAAGCWLLAATATAKTVTQRGGAGEPLQPQAALPART